jgi:hypothetical protein
MTPSSDWVRVAIGAVMLSDNGWATHDARVQLSLNANDPVVYRESISAAPKIATRSMRELPTQAFLAGAADCMLGG